MAGPFYKNLVEGPDPWVSTRVWSKTWYTQKPPFRKPLPFYITSQLGAPGRVSASSVPPASDTVPRGNVDNMLYEKFKKRLGESSETLVNLAEYDQARATVVKRAQQLGRFVKA